MKAWMLFFCIIVCLLVSCANEQHKQIAKVTSPTVTDVAILMATELAGMLKDGSIKEYVDKEVEVRGNLVRVSETVRTSTKTRAVLFIIASESKVQKEAVCEVFFEAKESFNTLFEKWMLTIRDNKSVRVRGKLYISNINGNVALMNSELLEY